jgi:hypothetical protein
MHISSNKTYREMTGILDLKRLNCLLKVTLLIKTIAIIRK